MLAWTFSDLQSTRQELCPLGLHDHSKFYWLQQIRLCGSKYRQMLLLVELFDELITQLTVMLKKEKLYYLLSVSNWDGIL